MKTKLTLFVAVLAFCFQQSLIGADLKKGLVAYYPFNGNARDESGNGHHGKTISRQGAKVVLTVDRNGVDDRAYRLDGPISGIDVGEFEFKPITKITISSWVRLAERNLRNYEESAGHPDYGIFFGGGTHGHDFHLLIHEGRGGIGVRYKGGIGDSTGDVNLKSLLPLGKWLHIVLTADGRKTLFYINGSSVGKTKAEGGSSNVNSKGKFHIGTGTPKGNFNGDIDDVRIYNHALSAEEVKALYDLEKPKGK